MLCLSPMPNLLKLQQQMTFRTSHCINACSVEKHKPKPSLQLTVDSSQIATRRQPSLLFPGRRKDIWIALTKPHSDSMCTETYTLLHHNKESSLWWQQTLPTSQNNNSHATSSDTLNTRSSRRTPLQICRLLLVKGLAAGAKPLNKYVYIYIYIYISAYPFRGLTGVCGLFSLLWFPHTHTHPKMRSFGCGHFDLTSPKRVRKSALKLTRSRTHFWIDFGYLFGSR